MGRNAISGAGVIVPGQVIAATSYAPGVLNSLSVAGTTFAAFSSALVNTGAFTVPASGNVLVTVNCVSMTATGITGVAMALAEHGTVTPLIGNSIQWLDPNQTGFLPRCLQFLITGLTPGSVHTFDLVGASGNGADSLIIPAQSLTSTTLVAATRGAPVTMLVQAM